MDRLLPISEFLGHTERIVDRLVRLTGMESPSTDKSLVDRLGQHLKDELEALGAKVTVIPQDTTGDHLLAEVPGSSTEKPILCLCHMDTVYPAGTLERMPCRIENEKLHGPGVLDMKGGIAILIEALQVLKEYRLNPNRPLRILINSDEETGSHTSREIIEAQTREAALVVCLEPALPDGSLKTWRKGVGRFEISAYGRAAHAGADHAQGRNAIEELAHQVIKVQGLTDYDLGTTVNIGLIRGGTASNVVPAEARAEVDLRVLSQAEADRVIGALQGLRPVLEGTRIEVLGELNRPPMPRDNRMVESFERVRELGWQLGIKLTEGGTGGGSDANFAAALGIPVLDGMGAQGEGLHSEREFILIKSLGEKAGLLANLLRYW